MKPEVWLSLRRQHKRTKVVTGSNDPSIKVNTIDGIILILDVLMLASDRFYWEMRPRVLVPR